MFSPFPFFAQDEPNSILSSSPVEAVGAGYLTVGAGGGTAAATPIPPRGGSAPTLRSGSDNPPSDAGTLGSVAHGEQLLPVCFPLNASCTPFLVLMKSLKACFTERSPELVRAHRICFITSVPMPDIAYVIIPGSYEAGSVNPDSIALQSPINTQIRDPKKSHGGGGGFVPFH